MSYPITYSNPAVNFVNDCVLDIRDLELAYPEGDAYQTAEIDYLIDLALLRLTRPARFVDGQEVLVQSDDYPVTATVHVEPQAWDASFPLGIRVDFFSSRRGSWLMTPEGFQTLADLGEIR